MGITSLHKFNMKIKDHFLSQEIFEVKPSDYPGILETYPKPSEEKLAAYYDSPDYISHQIDTKSLKDIIYQGVKTYMIKRKKQQILKFHQSGKILDIGAGTGDFLLAFNNESWQKFAVEPTEKLHSILKQKDIQRSDNLSEFDDNSFHVISLWHSLEHIPNLQETILELKRLLKPDGVIFIAVPNFESYDAHFYKSYWAAWDLPRHLWHFSRSGLKSICSQSSLKCIKEKALPFDAFYVALLSENYKPRGIRMRSFFIGMLSNLKAMVNKEFSSVIYVLRHSEEI